MRMFPDVFFILIFSVALWCILPTTAAIYRDSPSSHCSCDTANYLPSFFSPLHSPLLTGRMTRLAVWYDFFCFWYTMVFRLFLFIIIDPVSVIEWNDWAA